MTLKCCKVFGELKPLDAFYKMKGMRDGHRNECKACNLQQKHQQYLENPATEIARVKAWQQANADRVNAYQRSRRERPDVKAANRAGHLKRKFGLTSAEYQSRLVAQGGVCAICERPPAEGRSLDIDHDHRTGEVPGLVCNSCNQGLGLFSEDTFRLMSAAAYLSGWEAPGRGQRVRFVIGG
jgi:hypothetical protein